MYLISPRGRPAPADMIRLPWAKPAKTATMIRAAPVMMRAVEATPKVIAVAVSWLWS
jgi:hypothetical protein